MCPECNTFQISPNGGIHNQTGGRDRELFCSDPRLYARLHLPVPRPEIRNITKKLKRTLNTKTTINQSVNWFYTKYCHDYSKFATVLCAKLISMSHNISKLGCRHLLLDVFLLRKSFYLLATDIKHSLVVL